MEERLHKHRDSGENVTKTQNVCGASHVYFVYKTFIIRYEDLRNFYLATCSLNNNEETENSSI